MNFENLFGEIYGERILDELTKQELTLEGLSMIQESEASDGVAMYVLLTDTKSWFQDIARRITKQPYNHVSLSFDSDLNEVYSYSIYTAENGFRGGLMREDKKELMGAKYSLYMIRLDHEAYRKVRTSVSNLIRNKDKTNYNTLGLINAIFDVDIFKTDDGQKMICSEFVSNVFENAGIKLLNNKYGSRVKPYDLVKSKLLKFVRRGTIK